MATKFRTFIYGVLAPVTWPLSFQWYPIIPRPQARIRSAFRTCRACLTSQSRWSVALAFMAKQRLSPGAPFHVCFGSLADIGERISDVRFTPESGREASPLKRSALLPDADIRFQQSSLFLRANGI